MMNDDLELLSQYARHGTEHAFETLVRRHSALVYSAALRLVRNPHTAEEVAQAVFIELAHSAKRMKPDTILPAWLHRVTRSRAIDALRRDSSRQRREQVAAVEEISESAPVSDMEPMLDDALDALTDLDRAAVMLRFFEEKSLGDVGNALGISADAAQKRVSRAVEQLRGFFTRRGIAVGTAGVAAVLSANTVKAAPASLASGICSAVKATTLTTATHASASTLIKSIAMTTSQQALVAAAAIAVGVSGGYYAGRNPDAPATYQPPAITSPPRHAGDATRSAASRIRSARIATRKPGRVDRTQALMDFYAGLDSDQLAAEAAKLDQLPSSEILIASFLLYSRWGEVDPTAALNGIGQRGFLTPTILRSWATVDAKAAGVYCRLHGNTHDIAAELAWQDPDAALAWAKSLRKEDRFAEVWVLRQLAKSDPARAWELAAESDDDFINSRAHEEIAGQWALKDFATAARHIAALPDDIRNSALSAAVQSLARTDPKQAATYLGQITGYAERSCADDAVKESMARLFPGETAAIPPLKPGDQLREDEITESEGMGEDESPDPLLTDPDFGVWYLEHNL